MTYGWLLKPHRENKYLTWNDFSEDLHYIHLQGNRNKLSRNRIAPIPSYVSDIFVKGNIFSGIRQPLNQYYFKTLWGRFKKQSNTLKQKQVFYSFRQTGAVKTFRRIGSLTKLQKAMGYSSLNFKFNLFTRIIGGCIEGGGYVYALIIFV